MTTSNIRTPRSECDQIEEALIQDIIYATEQELRDELIAAGRDPDKCIAEINLVISDAKSKCAKLRFENAKTALAAFKSKIMNLSPSEHEAARLKLESIRSNDNNLASKMMIAARKGDGPTDNDINGLIDDIAMLERLIRDQENK